MTQAPPPDFDDLEIPLETPDEDEFDTPFDDEDEGFDTDDPDTDEDVTRSAEGASPPAEMPVYTRRLFFYNSHEIADPNPDFTVDQVRKLLVPYFEDLVNASASSQVTPDGIMRVTFAKRATTKGSLTVRHLAQILGEVAPAALLTDETQQVVDLLHAPVDLVWLADHTDAIESFLEHQEATQSAIHKVVTRCTALSPVPLTHRVPLGF